MVSYKVEYELDNPNWDKHSNYNCQACGDNGLIDLGYSGDTHLLYYCNYCDFGIELEKHGRYKDIVIG